MTREHFHESGLTEETENVLSLTSTCYKTTMSDETKLKSKLKINAYSYDGTITFSSTREKTIPT